MVDLLQVYRQTFAPACFVGKKYGENDRKNGTFAHLWQGFFARGEEKPLLEIASNRKSATPEDNALIGLLRCEDGEETQYLIGMFLPADTVTPAGYMAIPFSAANIATCWLCGPPEEVFKQEMVCHQKLLDEGYRFAKDEAGAMWFYERYVHPRFTEPDDEGNVVLDMCFFIK